MPDQPKSLEPCPFCAGTNVEMRSYYSHSTVAFHGGDHDSHSVYCMDCKISGPSAFKVEDAADAWNARPGPGLGQNEINIDKMAGTWIESRYPDMTKDENFSPVDALDIWAGGYRSGSTRNAGYRVPSPRLELGTP